MTPGDRSLDRARTATGLDVLLGAWLILSPFALGFSGRLGATLDDVVLGIGIGVLAGAHLLRVPEGAWLRWATVLAAVWVMISPLVLGFSHTPPALWNNVIAGIVGVILAARVIDTARA